MKNFILAWTIILLGSFLNPLKAQDAATPEMSPLNYQIGKWLAKEVKTDQEGRKLQFGYELQWFDHKKSIAKMVITGIYEDGEVRLYWEGFKHWDPIEMKILYYGFSADGRAAKGYLEIVDDQTINTNYSGIDRNGDPVQIKDTATKIDDTHHRSETLLKQKGKDWMKVNTDNWVKVTTQQFNDQLN